jgi:hypothetical protein
VRASGNEHEGKESKRVYLPAPEKDISVHDFLETLPRHLHEDVKTIDR